MTNEDSPLEIGDWCAVVSGVYKDELVKIIDLPDKHDARYSVSRNGFAGLRLSRDKLRLIDRPQVRNELCR